MSKASVVLMDFGDYLIHNVNHSKHALVSCELSEQFAGYHVYYNYDTLGSTVHRTKDEAIDTAVKWAEQE